MKRKVNAAPVMRVGAKVRALYDHQPFATPDTTIRYRKDEIGRVERIHDDGGLVVRFANGIPTRIISTGEVRKIIFSRDDFTVIG